MYMVATYVLDLEAGIGDGRKQQAAGPVLDLRILVDQLVAEVDGDDAADTIQPSMPNQL